MKFKILIAVAVLVAFASISKAQSINSSQFYTLGQVLNPALAGDASFSRISFYNSSVRVNTGEIFTNNTVAADQKAINQHSGLGFVMQFENQTINQLKFQVNYSYTTSLFKTLWFKGGLGLSVNHRALGSSSLLFPDQYNNQGPNGQPTQEPDLYEETTFVGVATGGLVYTRWWWVGVAFDYLNRPKEKWTSYLSQVPIKYSLHGGFLYPINKNYSSRRRFSKYGGLKPYNKIGPQLSVTRFGNETDIQAYMAAHFQPVFGSIGYRTIQQYVQAETFWEKKSVNFMVGFRREEFSISYAYDAPLTSNNYTFPTHHLSIVIYIASAKNDFKMHQLVPMPNQLLY